MGIFFTIILIFFLLSWLLSKLFPLILTRWVNKKMGGDRAAGSDNRENGRKIGDVYVSGEESKQEKVVEKNMGEYVDFEPVKEDKNNGDI